MIKMSKDLVDMLIEGSKEFSVLLNERQIDKTH
jgi:hypothetical protein